MNTNISHKIRLLLNELAILNQPGQKDGMLLYEKDNLLKIKSLGSELYFLSEKAMDQNEFSAETQEIQMREEIPAIPEVMPEQEEILPEPSPIAQEEIIEPDLTPEELKDDMPNTNSERTADSVNNQISFTRRFEYINNLFGGNTELYLEFLETLAQSTSEEEAMEKYKLAFQENNWSKREETAHDFKKLIHKIF